MPPKMPRAKDAKPNSADTISPSACGNPAKENAITIALSRTPQPAIDIGTVATKSTGGVSTIASMKLKGDATLFAASQAVPMVSP